MTKWALGRKREVEKPGFFGGFYMVGIRNKLSGDPVVCPFIMISTRLSILSSPHSSIILPLFVLCFALISRPHPFLLDFSVSLVYLQTIAIIHVSLKTCNKRRVKRTFFHVDNMFLHRGCFRSSIVTNGIASRRRPPTISLHCSLPFDRRKIVRNLPPRAGIHGARAERGR